MSLAVAVLVGVGVYHHWIEFFVLGPLVLASVFAMAYMAGFATASIACTFRGLWKWDWDAILGEDD